VPVWKLTLAAQHRTTLTRSESKYQLADTIYLQVGVKALAGHRLLVAYACLHVDSIETPRQKNIPEAGVAVALPSNEACEAGHYRLHGSSLAQASQHQSRCWSLARGCWRAI